MRIGLLDRPLSPISAPRKLALRARGVRRQGARRPARLRALRSCSCRSAPSASSARSGSPRRTSTTRSSAATCSRAQSGDEDVRRAAPPRRRPPATLVGMTTRGVSAARSGPTSPSAARASASSTSFPALRSARSPVGPDRPRADAGRDLRARPWIGRDGVFHKRDDRVVAALRRQQGPPLRALASPTPSGKGARSLVTVGGLASTQVMATILFGRSSASPSTAVLFDQPVTRSRASAVLTDMAAGGRLVHGGGYLATARAHLPRAPARGAPVPDPARRLERRSRASATSTRCSSSASRCAGGGAAAGRHRGAVRERGHAGGARGGRGAPRLADARDRRPDHRAPRLQPRHDRACASQRSTMRFLAKHAGRSLGLRCGDAASPSTTARSARATATRRRTRSTPSPRSSASRRPGEVTYSGKGLVGLRAVARAHPRETCSTGIRSPACGRTCPPWARTRWIRRSPTSSRGRSRSDVLRPPRPSFCPRRDVR